ncbi:acyl-CoA dehydrogenase [Paracoccidioides lutzii Pb01]|uniref:Acyl-CoA dehydrogenase n=1 Tax=Paracoccidioides lutzii (strain ATCC MYA-826 / Pb01) TaxID=502779 RepID=C1H837_PARBA|nr:acyl-CoA dehydrogenase [Paracoccidioides lutzii Pb01]EEH36596.1 acyl-CoA dehydrogenase [Paracoccidioides lutzii Pb01]
MASAPFGSAAPYAEPLWHSRQISPYYSESHKKVQAYVRDYVDNNLKPYAEEYEKQGFLPPEALRLHAEKGFTIIKPTKREYMGGVSLPAGIEPEEWDEFHNLIVVDELNRLGYSGVIWGLFGGNGIGCPPIMNFGSEAQRLEYMPKVSRGEIRFCLGITEPDAGSDVANIKTTAKRSGNKYIVNGAKKWITNGLWANYCTAAVRTGGPGRKGISLLIVPLAAKGVTRRRMENSGVNASGSTFIEFDDVEVPVENLIGTENHGFTYIMSNFNPERLSMAAACIRLSRVCAEDAYNYAIKRETFGQPLIANQIIRAKFSKFGELIEPCQAYLEQLAYTLHVAAKTGQQGVDVGGMTALLKVMTTRCLEKVCREAQQVMGGAGYNKSGKGARIEQISRDVRVFVVGGGSREILSDLAVRQEMKNLNDLQHAAKKGAKI